MRQTNLLIIQIKKLLKSQGLNYRDLAKKLKISESSVKRIFAKNTFTLDRLDEICEVLEVEFYDLAKMIKSSEPEIQRSLSIEQEKILSRDEKLFVYFYLLATGHSPESIIKKFRFSENESVLLLLKLDKLKMIEYHSLKKVKLLFSRNIQWHKDGPLNQKYEQMIKQEFLQSKFSSDQEGLYFISGQLTEQDLKNLNHKIRKLVSEIIENSEMNEKNKNVTKIWLLFAYRPWSFSPLLKYKI